MAAEHSVRDRAKEWPEDFTQNGGIRLTRPNRGHAANTRTGKDVRDIVYRGWYVLQGDEGAK